jgi:hypothetical protein
LFKARYSWFFDFQQKKLTNVQTPSSHTEKVSLVSHTHSELLKQDLQVKLLRSQIGAVSGHCSVVQVCAILLVASQTKIRSIQAQQQCLNINVATPLFAFQNLF